MPSKSRVAGLPNLVSPNAHERVMLSNGALVQIARKSQFWRPIFAWLPLRAGGFRPGGMGNQASGPVNASTSYAGITVTPELSLNLSSVWACIGRYQNTVSTLPFNVMQVAGDNGAKPLRTHPLYRVLHDQPNSQQSATAFWKGFMGQMMTWGVGYARKLTGTQGQVVGLTPLLSAAMTAYFDAGGRLRYNYQPGPPDQAKDFAADEIFVVLDRTMDGFSPMSRIQYAANSLGLAMSGDRAASLSFKNGLRASGILSIAQWLKKDQREAYREQVNQFVGTGTGDGNDKQFGVLVAENATKFDAINVRPIDIELLAARRYSVEDVARWYDVPPILISHAAEGQTMWGSGIEQIILGWLKLGLSPVLRTIEQEVWRQLLSPAEQAEGVFAEFNLDGLLRGDSAARAEFLSKMTTNGIYTRNFARALENLPPLPGGDILTVQSALTPLENLGKIPAQDAQQLRAALRTWLGVEDKPDAPEAKDT